MCKSGEQKGSNAAMWPSCKLNEDDMMHVLWNCEEAQRIWCCRKEVIKA